jgi:hypothetical protein
MNRHLWLSSLVLVLAVGARAAGQEALEVSGLKSTPPAAWKKEKPANALQFAVFSVPKSEGDKDDTLVLIFYTGPQGMGTEQANLQRYKGMFKAPAGDNAKVEKLKVGDRAVTYVDLQGTYLQRERPADPSSPTVEKPDYRMIAVIAEGKQGPFYVRFIGPAKTVDKNKKDFDDWLKNFK